METKYWTVGQVARRMGVTVRTLQHYDREGLLPPSAVSEGGRRLYSDRDLVRLHQILSLRHLGFSLKDIRGRLAALDTPEQVAAALAGQAASLRAQAAALERTVAELEALRAEVLQMDAVDFRRYADIVVNLQMGNAHYGLLKHFGDRTMEQIRSRFDQETGRAFLARFQQLQARAARLLAAGADPAGDEGQRFAAEYWAMVSEFTGGDAAVLAELVELGQSGALEADWTAANDFVGPALEAYFARQGADPFAEAQP